MIEFDADFARGLFPSGLWRWAFFENAGGSYVPNSVIERVCAYMTESQVQPGGAYPASDLAARRMADGHEAMAAMMSGQGPGMKTKQRSKRKKVARRKRSKRHR